MMNGFSPNQYPLVALRRTGAEKQENWRKLIVRMMPPTLPMLMVILAMAVFMIQDYFLLEMVTVAMSSVAVTSWLSRMRSRYPQITKFFNKQTGRTCWVVYWLSTGFFSISPAVAQVAAGTTGAGGACSATNTILGPVADALVKVFSSSSQVGSTGTISENICQVFTTYAAIIALLILGSVFWGLFDNQGRGADLGKAFTPLGVVLAAVVVSRITIKMVMGV
jgi:hypothetical protein